MDINKVKALYALLTGGIGGILKYINRTVNTQLLGKIKDKETALKYIKDVQAIYALCRTLLDNHGDKLSESKKKAADKVLAALEELTKALEDFRIDDEEVDAIIERINDAIDAFQAAK